MFNISLRGKNMRKFGHNEIMKRQNRSIIAKKLRVFPMHKELDNMESKSKPKKFTGSLDYLYAVGHRCNYSIRKVLSGNRMLRRIVKPKIVNAYIELTDNCNLNCRMCNYRKMHGKTGFMSRLLYESCIKQLSQMGLGTLYLHFGGESLLHPDFKEFLKYAIYYRDHGGIQNVAWIDNGMLFNSSISDLVLDLKVDAISFSIDGVGEVNDRIRTGSKYPVIQKNIKYLVNKRGQAKKPQVYLSMCDYGKTEEQKTDVYREWCPVVDGITLIPSIRSDNTWERDPSSAYKTIKPPAFCSFPFETIAISWDGKVTGCCLDYFFNMNLGDATKLSLSQIWNGPNYQALRKAALAGTFATRSPCYRCEFWKVNFEPQEETILDGAATISYGYIYRKINRLPKTNS